MKLHNKLMTYGMRAVLCTGLTLTAFGISSCNDDDQQTVPLKTPEVEYDITYNTLSFSWDDVPQAIQYGYSLTDEAGDPVSGGVTTETSVFIDGLQKTSGYTLVVYAYPALNSDYEPSCISINMQTPFYTALHFSGTYTSTMTNNSWTADIEEERTESVNSFGTFTLKNWYGVEGYDLQFTVNTDNTIHVLNGTEDATTGYVNVTTGSGQSTVRSGLLIDESRCLFDREEHTLTIYGKASRGTREGYDTFTWEE